MCYTIIIARRLWRLARFVHDNHMFFIVCTLSLHMLCYCSAASVCYTRCCVLPRTVLHLLQHTMRVRANSIIPYYWLCVNPFLQLFFYYFINIVLDKHITVCYTVGDVVLLHTLRVLALCSVCVVCCLSLCCVSSSLCCSSLLLCVCSLVCLSLFSLCCWLLHAACPPLYNKAPIPLYYTTGFLSTPN